MRYLSFNNFFYSALIFSAFFLTSCEEKQESENVQIEVNDDYYEFQDFILSDFEIPAIISLPDETANIGASTKPEVDHIGTDIKWTINVGQNFQLLIEDYADLTDLIEVEKKSMKEKDFYKINYIIDEPDLILYERVLDVKGMDNASPTVGVEHRSFHVYGQKEINGITYELRSRPEGYEKVIIELMAKSIKSFKPYTKKQN